MEDYDASKDPNYVDELFIGTIDFGTDDTESIKESEVEGNNRLNFGKNIGECKIEVFGKEGNIPHFHINGINSDFKSCVCIYSNNYFSHGGKYNGTLNSSQRNKLDVWLNDRNSMFPLYSNWFVIKEMWDNFNQGCKFPNNRKVASKPDYTKMDKFKDK